jgi:hypothetical protein
MRKQPKAYDHGRRGAAGWPYADNTAVHDFMSERSILTRANYISGDLLNAFSERESAGIY